MEAVQERESAQQTVQRTAYLNREEILNGKPVYRFFKRLQDIVLSGAALVVFSPVLAVTALAIMLDSPGRPVFAQERVGKNGKRFRFYKFRSMVNNAESMLGDLLEQNEMEGPAFKIRNDPRITRVGRFIRKTSLDELPQLWNVLRGDMTIIGPRPPLPREVEQYDDYQAQRLYVTPGLSCYWQIQPSRNSLSFDEWVELDLQYIRERSFLTDWKIIFQTIGAVLGMDGI